MELKPCVTMEKIHALVCGVLENIRTYTVLLIFSVPYRQLILTILCGVRTIDEETKAEELSCLPQATEGIGMISKIRTEGFLAAIPVLKPLDHASQVSFRGQTSFTF